MIPPPRRDLDQSLLAVGRRVTPLTDLYAFLMRTRWPVVVGLAGAAFLVVNFLFGLAYWAIPDAIANSDGSLLDAFFFSVQTFAAIGYGYMYSQGTLANTVVTVEAFVSLLCLALLTGIVFAKFARPHARVLFSEVAVIERRNGVPTLTFRVANERGNDVVEASMRVSALKTLVTHEGQRIRRFYDLALERSSSPLFRLSWQVFHPITEDSPIHGMTPDEMLEQDVRIIVALTGLDGTFAQTIHARNMYWPEQVLPNKRFVDVIEDLNDGRIRMDFRKFHMTEDQVLAETQARADADEAE